MIADNGRVHRAPIFGVRTKGGFLTDQRPHPFLVVGVDRVPIGDDAADGDQYGDETQPGQPDFSKQIKSLKDILTRHKIFSSLGSPIDSRCVAETSAPAVLLRSAAKQIRCGTIPK